MTLVTGPTDHIPLPISIPLSILVTMSLPCFFLKCSDILVENSNNSDTTSAWCFC